MFNKEKKLQKMNSDLQKMNKELLIENENLKNQLAANLDLMETANEYKKQHDKSMKLLKEAREEYIKAKKEYEEERRKYSKEMDNLIKAFK